MTKVSNKFKKPWFWSIIGPFSLFLGKKDFLKKIWPCNAQQDFSPQHHAKFKKKLMNQSQENFRTDGRTDGQTLFYRTLSATAGCPIKAIIKQRKEKY